MTESEARTKPISEVWGQFFHNWHLQNAIKNWGKSVSDQGKYVRYDNYETCLNMSAAYAFWAWELKQRQLESNGR